MANLRCTHCGSTLSVETSQAPTQDVASTVVCPHCKSVIESDRGTVVTRITAVEMPVREV